MATVGLSTKKSTIVRSFSQPRFLRFVLALAEREAPGLGARLALRLWLTVPPSAGKPTEETVPGRREVLAGKLVAESWGDGPPVYLMHGWGGRREQFGAFVRPLADAGFRVIVLDAPGHGESGPGALGRGRAYMLDFIGALRTAVARYGDAHAVIGHSFGASAAAVAALDGLAVRRLVLIAPVTNVLSGLDIFSRNAGIGPRVRARMPHQIERVARRPVADFDIAARAAECDELPEALVIHDGADKEVPFDNGVLVAAAWPGGRLSATEGLGHKRILRDAGVIAEVTGFVAARAGRPAA
jgi:pimeloyl-ACP methyl ester carboxylesterase